VLFRSSVEAEEKKKEEMHSQAEIAKMRARAEKEDARRKQDDVARSRAALESRRYARLVLVGDYCVIVM